MSAFADSRLQRMIIGNSLSSFGDSALYLSLSIWAKDITGSNSAAGAVFLAQGLPSLFSPLAGHLVDRVSRRNLLVIANAATALAVLSLLFVHSDRQLWLMYAVAAFYGTSFLFIRPASSGLIKDMLPDEDLGAANAAFITIGQGLRIVSPLVGAALYARFGGGSLAILDAATFGFAILMLLSIRVTESAVPPAEQVSVRERMLVGLRYVRDTRVLAQITMSGMIAMLVLGFYESLTFAVVAALGRPASFFGVLMSIQAVGSIVGGLFVTKLMKRFGEPRTLGFALLAWAVASAVYTIQSLPSAVVALVIFGIAVPLYAVAFSTATQRFTPPRLQGRVGSATNMLGNLSQTLSIAIGAALIDTIDYRILLVIVTVVAAGAALPVVLRPAPAPAPTPSATPVPAG
ncbi:MAG: MFS transporter [Actinomycetota bacterium]|nr:MFS transporter [Actinomycetota bacterium]